MVLPLLGALIPAAAGLIGGLFQNSAQQASANKQMDFQKEMDSTRYQRGMADMKAAGLNPILAYSQGGAGSPSGAQANVTNVGAAAVEGLQKGVSSAGQANLMREQLENLSADTRLKLAQGSSAVEQAKLANANSAVVLGTMPAVVQKAIWDSGISGANYSVLGPKVDRADIEKDYLGTEVGKILATGAIAGSDMNAATSALKNVNPGDWIGKTFKSLGW